jgi:uncharacterized protein (DUF427 family)
MAKAEYNGAVLGDSEVTVVVEGNHYFPPGAVDRTVLREAELSTHCPWKGDAAYYDVVVDGETVPNGAWYYPEPMEAAAEIRDHIAFYVPPVAVTD